MIKKTDGAGNLSGWIEALGVDPSYRPPPEREVRPVACVYVVQQEGGDGRRGPYRAVYLFQRTSAELKGRVAAKWDVDPGLIVGMTRVMPGGMEVEMDDDVVREVAEGQDMVLEVVETGSAVKTEWEMMIDTGDGEGEVDGEVEGQKGRGYELRFHF